MPVRIAWLIGAALIACGVAVAVGLPHWWSAESKGEGVPELRPVMLVLPPGEFWMGSPTDDPEADEDEKPRHRVRIPRRFALAQTEVTQAQWRAVMGGNPSYFQENGDNKPVERVTWYAAVAYLNRLSEREGLSPCYVTSGPKGDPNDGGTEPYSDGGFSFESVTFTAGCTGYRLPTEAEWEYAGRAGTTAARYGELNAIAWWGDNSGSETHPVAGKQANPWFFFDLLGNVWEWTHSEFDDYPAAGAVVDDAPTLAWGPRVRVFRGCGWSSDAALCRAADRDHSLPGNRYHFLGFRPARFLDP